MLAQDRSNINKIAAVALDVRGLAMGCLVGLASFAPNFMLRTGGFIAILIVVILLGDSARRLGLTDGLAALYVLLIGASMQWTSEDVLTLNSFKNAITFIGLLIAVRMTIARARDFKLVAYGLVVGCLVSLAQVLQQTGASIRIRYDVNAPRIGLSDVNLNYSAYTFATAAAVIIALITLNRRASVNGTTPFLALALGAMYVGILLNGTRGALLATLLLAPYVLASQFRPTLVFRCTIFGIVGTGIAIFVGWLGEDLVPFVQQSARETGDLNGRLTVWPIARHAFLERPIQGHGAGALPGLTENPYGIAAHNALLDVASGVGILGLVLFVGILWSALFRDTRTCPSPTRELLIGSFLLVSAPLLLSGYWIESPVFWGIVGLFSRVSVLPIATWRNVEPTDAGVQARVT